VHPTVRTHHQSFHAYLFVDPAVLFMLGWVLSAVASTCHQRNLNCLDLSKCGTLNHIHSILNVCVLLPIEISVYPYIRNMDNAVASS
jgi:hypothetical protein